MGGIFGERVTIGQQNGPDVELIVSGDESYARYERPDGYPAIYDTKLGLFVHALLDNGELVSSGVPIVDAPPPGAVKHARESDEVRRAKVAEKLAARGPRSRASQREKPPSAR